MKKKLFGVLYYIRRDRTSIAGSHGLGKGLGISHQPGFYLPYHRYGHSRIKAGSGLLKPVQMPLLQICFIEEHKYRAVNMEFTNQPVTVVNQTIYTYLDPGPDLQVKSSEKRLHSPEKKGIVGTFTQTGDIYPLISVIHLIPPEGYGSDQNISSPQTGSSLPLPL
jgi:hypothetical protein